MRSANVEKSSFSMAPSASSAKPANCLIASRTSWSPASNLCETAHTDSTLLLNLSVFNFFDSIKKSCENPAPCDLSCTRD